MINIINTIRLILLPLGWICFTVVGFSMVASLFSGVVIATAVSSLGVGFKLVPQKPQYLASIRTGRKQLGQMVGIILTPFSV